MNLTSSQAASLTLLGTRTTLESTPDQVAAFFVEVGGLA